VRTGLLEQPHEALAEEDRVLGDDHPERHNVHAPMMHRGGEAAGAPGARFASRCGGAEPPPPRPAPQRGRRGHGRGPPAPYHLPDGRYRALVAPSADDTLTESRAGSWQGPIPALATMVRSCQVHIGPRIGPWMGVIGSCWVRTVARRLTSGPWEVHP